VQYLAALKPIIANLALNGTFKVGLEHMLLGAILIVLVGIWRAVHLQTQALSQRKED